jgi:hypothetical protein
VSAGETDVLAEKMGEEQTRLDVFFIQAPVDRNANGLFHELK